MVACSRLREVTLDFHGAVKHPKDVDITVLLDQVSDSIVSENENPKVLSRMSRIAVADFGETPQDLGLVLDRLDRPGGCSRVVFRDKRIDVMKPLLSFGRPVQLCHERMRWPISS